MRTLEREVLKTFWGPIFADWEQSPGPGVLEFNFMKKEIPAQIFSCEFCEILHNIFFKEPFRRLLLHKTRSVYCPSTTFYFFKNDDTHIFQLSIFSA